ncbi:MAG: cysteine hydrolase family protein [Christensenellales bacterium]
MTDLLVVVDMQRDFVSGALGSEQARAIVPAVAARIQQAKAENTQVVFTLDTHEENYEYPRGALSARAALHPQYASAGRSEPEIAQTCTRGMMSFEKPTFGLDGAVRVCLHAGRRKGAVAGKGFHVELCVRVYGYLRSFPTPCSSRPPCPKPI